MLAGRSADVRQLINAGLWVELDGGYAFHDWHNYQPSSDAAAAKREARAAAGRKGAAARWGAKRAES